MEQRRHNRPTARAVSLVATVVGPAAVVIVAAATQSARDDLGVANAALLLAMITVAAALVSFRAGLATSVAAAFSLNYFHTEPIHSLRITSGADLASVSLLAAMGIGVSIATALRVRRAVVSHHADAAAGVADRLEGSLVQPRPAIELWHGAIDAAGAQFANIDARVVHTDVGNLPVVGRRGAGIDADGDHVLVTLPEGGAVVHFVDPGRTERLVLAPRVGLGAVEVERRAVFAFADQLEAVLGRSAADTVT